DPPRLEPAGEPLNLGEQPGVGHVALLALLAAPVERDAVTPAGEYMPVEAVVRDVERPVGEPGVERRAAGVEHRAERGMPVPPLPGLLGPPGGPGSRRARVVALVADLGLRGEARGRRERLDRGQLVDTVR